MRTVVCFHDAGFSQGVGRMNVQVNSCKDVI